MAGITEPGTYVVRITAERDTVKYREVMKDTKPARVFTYTVEGGEHDGEKFEDTVILYERMWIGASKQYQLHVAVKGYAPGFVDKLPSLKGGRFKLALRPSLARDGVLRVESYLPA